LLSLSHSSNEFPIEKRWHFDLVGNADEIEQRLPNLMKNFDHGMVMFDLCKSSNGFKQLVSDLMLCPEKATLDTLKGLGLVGYSFPEGIADGIVTTTPLIEHQRFNETFEGQFIGGYNDLWDMVYVNLHYNRTHARPDALGIRPRWLTKYSATALIQQENAA